MRTPIAPEHLGGRLYLTDEGASIAVRINGLRSQPVLFLDGPLLAVLAKYEHRRVLARHVDMRATLNGPPSKAYPVFVYPDEEQYEAAPEWKSDDYEVRATELCAECDEELKIHYGEPLASCRCGVQEWPR